MNPNEPTSAPAIQSRPSRRRRWLRILGWGAVWLVTLALLGVAVENYLGAREWRAALAEARAAGEPVDLAQIIPPPAADADNFAAIPLFRPLLEYDLLPFSKENPSGGAKWRDPAAKEKLDQLKLPGGANGKADWRRSEFADLEWWRNEIKAEGGNVAADAAVLRALGPFDPALQAVREAAARPRARFPVHYEESFQAAVPHISVLMNLGRVTRLRTLAELSMGDTGSAQQDLLLGFSLAEALREEPLLISQLVRIATFDMCMQPLWEGLARRQWSEAQLASFELALQRPDFLAAFQSAMRGEGGIFTVPALDAVKKDPSLMFIFASFTPGNRPSPAENARRALAWMAPSGWIDFSKALLIRSYAQTIRAADPKAHRFFAQQMQSSNDKLVHSVRENRTPRNALAGIVFAAVLSTGERFAVTQVTLDEARVAIALERYRLAHGGLPESLAAIPTAPIDAMSGAPLHYRRAADGASFILYSVGWNERDDQGQPAWTTGNRANDWHEGDWVWPPYPAR